MWSSHGQYTALEARGICLLSVYQMWLLSLFLLCYVEAEPENFYFNNNLDCIGCKGNISNAEHLDF